jgi:hypothetical protein
MVLKNSGRKIVFNNIDEVNWSELRQAHGDAGHVPEAIKGLIASDPKVQEASYWKLDNHIVLQGDLYQAAFYVIPFLIEILKSNIQSGRNYVYDLLFEIANGCAPDEVSCVYDGLNLPLTDACKRVIADNINTYLAEVANASSDCRESALDLLISLEEQQDKIISKLSDVRNKENNSSFRSKLEEAIAEIEG